MKEFKTKYGDKIICTEKDYNRFMNKINQSRKKQIERDYPPTFAKFKKSMMVWAKQQNDKRQNTKFNKPSPTEVS